MMHPSKHDDQANRIQVVVKAGHSVASSHLDASNASVAYASDLFFH